MELFKQIHMRQSCYMLDTDKAENVLRKINIMQFLHVNNVFIKTSCLPGISSDKPIFHS